jgi:hypothetical protein
MTLGAFAWQAAEHQVSPNKESSARGRLTGGKEMARGQWSTVRSEVYLAGSCIAGRRLGVGRDSRGRWESIMHVSSSERNLGGSTALVRRRSGDAEAVPPGPRVAPHRGDTVGPAHG